MFDFSFKWNIKGVTEEKAWEWFLELSQFPALEARDKVKIESDWREWCEASYPSFPFFHALAHFFLTIGLVKGFMEFDSWVYFFAPLWSLAGFLWILEKNDVKKVKDKVEAKAYWIGATNPVGPKEALEVLVAFEVKRKNKENGWLDHDFKLEGMEDFLEILKIK